MAIFKCKMCGGDLEVADGNCVIKCEYCETTQTIPSVDNEKKLNFFNRANRLRMNSEFDKAASIYESIVAEFPEEAEAYWGLCLCNYGIEYVDDPATGKKIPTCHRASFDSIQSDENFSLALEYADVVAQKVYRDEAREIDRIMQDILAVSRNEKPYDVFICYKETDSAGGRTPDSVVAQDVYDALTAKGLNVFFARITLEDKLGRQYEPYIFAALNSAKVMLVIGTKYEYFHAVWVKNEWSRFLKLMAKDKSKLLIPCFKDIDAYDMPEEFKNLQAQDMGKLGAIQDLVRGVEKIVGKDNAPVVSVQSASVLQSDNLIKRGYFFLEDGDFSSADEYFDKALDNNPEAAMAYLGKVLAGLHMCDIESLNNTFVKLKGNKNFERAVKFAKGSEVPQLETIKETAEKKWLVKHLTSALSKISVKQEKNTLLKRVSQLAATPTVSAYDEIVSICNDNRKFFNSTAVENAKIKLAILSLLTDAAEYTVSAIKSYAKFPYGVTMTTSRIEFCLNEMITDGVICRGYAPDSYCIINAGQIREQKYNIKIYANASRTLETATKSGDYRDYLAAARMFESLGNYNDSMEKCSFCKQTGEEKKAEYDAYVESQRRIAQENAARLAEEQRIAEENSRRLAAQQAAMRQQGRCQYCGGVFKGLFTKKCSNCGREKDY